MPEKRKDSKGRVLKAPEMERMVVDLSGAGLHAGSRLTFVMEEADT